MIAGTLVAFFHSETPSKDSQRTLTFAERVAYQQAIEEVYWRHRIWPAERPESKPSLHAVMSQAQLEKKVTDYLRKSRALEDYWQRPITAEQLQAEMDRMAKHTKQPEVLRELFEALSNNPFVVAECLARPAVAERNLAVAASGHHSVKSSETKVQSKTAHLPNTSYSLPAISNRPNGCTDDTWTATTIVNVPDGRDFHSVVWTGSEMIVWGGQTLSNPVVNTGGRYNPSTDTWLTTSTTNAPSPRANHTAIWTGSEMIVWGGWGNPDFFNTGGRYDPGTDTWTATNTANAPAGRGDHTAVWAGSEMIVWGGNNGSYLNSGGRYDPASDTWTATNTGNAPWGRTFHTAIWTGSEMIVWGGEPNGTNTGGRYDPSTDTWTATNTTNAPEARFGHSAVWTNGEMIVWGGANVTSYFNTGGRYNPGTDSWTSTSTTNAPLGRWIHTAVWTGGEMVVWGGHGCFNTCDCPYLNSGGRYNPSTDSWIGTSTTKAPSARGDHTAVWTGSEMIVWGGFAENPVMFFDTGGRYCAQSNPPPPTPTATPTATATPCHVIGTQPVCGSLISGFGPTNFIVNLSDAADPASVDANDFRVNCIPASTFTLQNANTTIVFHFNTTPVTGYDNVMLISTGAFNCGNGPVAEFTCTFFWVLNTPTPTASPHSPTPTPTYTPTPTPIYTPTSTATATFTPTLTATSTPTATATPAGATPTPTARPAPTPRLRPTPAQRP